MGQMDKKEVHPAAACRTAFHTADETGAASQDGQGSREFGAFVTTQKAGNSAIPTVVGLGLPGKKCLNPSA